jgi:hypothetical protein
MTLTKFLVCRDANLKSPSDVYSETECFMDVSTERGIQWNAAERCGITPPGWPEKATYMFRDAIYVYDSGWLVPTAEWYAQQGERRW